MATTIPHARPFEPERAIARARRLTWIALAVLVLGFGLAMATVPIGGAVIGSGKVEVESRVKRIAHPVGGVVSEIRVANGDRVRRGAMLLRLDTTVVGADAQLSQLSVDQLLAQRARLDAERVGARTVDFPAELRARGDEGARRAMSDEAHLFALRRQEEGALRAQLAARIKQYREQIASYSAQIAAFNKQVALIEPERRGLRNLYDKGLVTLGRLNQLERSAVDLDGSIASLYAQIAQTEARISEAREQLIQLGESRRSAAGAQLGTVNATLNQQQVRSVSAGDGLERSVIRAPYDGVVDKLEFSAVGDVVKPAETILEIVPDREDLIVAGAVDPGDIDQIRVGQVARVRLTALNAAVTPEIRGRVAVVAPERTDDPVGDRSYYAVRIVLDARQLATMRDVRLVPGMPAEIHIETGSRSMLSYLLKPLRDQLARAFRDG